jgi:hypothetical protein
MACRPLVIACSRTSWSRTLRASMLTSGIGFAQERWPLIYAFTRRWMFLTQRTAYWPLRRKSHQASLSELFSSLKVFDDSVQVVAMFAYDLLADLLNLFNNLAFTHDFDSQSFAGGHGNQSDCQNIFYKK